MFRRKRNSKPTHKHDHRQLRIIDEKAPFHFVEAYKSLRTNIDFQASTNNYHTIMITSAGPWDGKSTVSINLALAMADSGKKVILVDCDLRRGSIATYLKIGRSMPGITNVLAKNKELDQVIVHKKDLKIDVLTVGAVPPNPSEVISSQAMVDLLEKLSEMYDYVFIDTPPVSVVTDAAILSRITDGVILVARANETTKQALSISKKNLEDVNAHILGVVLNDCNEKRRSSYGGEYYAY